MLSKKSIKVISVVVLAVMLLMTLSNIAFAAPIPKAGDLTEQEVAGVMGPITVALSFVKWGGLVAAVFVAMFVGIKFITSSPEGKAEVKKTAMFYVAGIVILLSASAIVTAIQSAIK